MDRLDKSPEKIKSMFDNIANQYDLFNNIISFFTHKFVKKQAFKNLVLDKNSHVLDLCCGSGDLGRILKDRYTDLKITGVDFSNKMIEIAQKNNPDIEYKQEDATNLSFKNNTFNCVVMGFGLRNIENQQKALSEIYRVLTPNGLFLHLDFGKNSPFNRLYDIIVLFILKFIAKDIKPYEYLIESKNTFLTPEELILKCEKLGFKNIQKQKLMFGIIAFQIFKKDDNTIKS